MAAYTCPFFISFSLYFNVYASRNEKKDPHAEGIHLDKARELYCKVLAQRLGNVYAANGGGIVLAERVHFDIAKEIFKQVQEAAAGNIFFQMPNVWVNLAHVYFAQGQFGLAVKMYQNCLRKFYFGSTVPFFGHFGSGWIFVFCFLV